MAASRSTSHVSRGRGNLQREDGPGQAQPPAVASRGANCNEAERPLGGSSPRLPSRSQCGCRALNGDGERGARRVRAVGETGARPKKRL